MRILMTLGGVGAVLLAGTGCRSHTAGQCDCTNQASSSYISTPAANYPVLGQSTVSSTPGTIAPNGVMGSSTAPMAMPSTMPSGTMAK